MKQFAYISLAIGLIWVGCSGGDTNTTPLPVSEPYPEGGEEGALPEVEGLMPGSSKEEEERLADSDLVLVERDGKFYRVYGIAKVPYEGKAVLYHPDGITESSEKVYKDGVLLRHSEWHANTVKKMEAVLMANGAMKTTYFDEEGNPVKAPVGIGDAPGRVYEWTYGGGLLQRRIDAYANAPSGIIKKVFGNPDEEQNSVWIYKGMKVTVFKTGQIMTTVRFTVSNEKVLSVSVEP